MRGCGAARRGASLVNVKGLLLLLCLQPLFQCADHAFKQTDQRLVELKSCGSHLMLSSKLKRKIFVLNTIRFITHFNPLQFRFTE